MNTGQTIFAQYDGNLILLPLREGFILNITGKRIMCFHRKIFVWIILLLLTFLTSALSGCQINQASNENQVITDVSPMEATLTPFPSSTPTPLSSTPSMTTGVSIFPSETAKSLDPESSYEQLRFFFRSIERNSIFFYDPVSDNSFQIESKYGNPIDFLDVNNHGCASTILLKNFDVVFWEQNPKYEQVLFTSAPFLESLGPDEHIWKVNISPDHKSLGFLVGSGYLGYDQYEIQNLFVIPVDNQNIKYQITQFGGATLPSWNSLSNLLAYTDYDAEGYHNLFSSEPDGTNRRILLTLSYPSERIVKFLWSPSGKRVALLLENDVQDNRQLAVLDVNHENSLRILPDITGVADFWWVSDTELLVDITAINAGNSTTKVRQIAEINIDTEDISYVLKEKETPEGYYELANEFKILDQDLGFLSYLGFYTFDPVKFEFVKVFDKFMDVSEWSACLEVDESNE